MLLVIFYMNKMYLNLNLMSLDPGLVATSQNMVFPTLSKPMFSSMFTFDVTNPLKKSIHILSQQWWGRIGLQWIFNFDKYSQNPVYGNEHTPIIG